LNSQTELKSQAHRWRNRNES